MKNYFVCKITTREAKEEQKQIMHRTFQVVNKYDKMNNVKNVDGVTHSENIST